MTPSTAPATNTTSEIHEIGLIDGSVPALRSVERSPDAGSHVGATLAHKSL
jgi:hypothetical protein